MSVVVDRVYIESGRKEAAESRKFLTELFKKAYPEDGEAILNELVDAMKENIGRGERLPTASSNKPAPNRR